MAKNVGDLGVAITGLGETVPVTVNGREVVSIVPDRDAAGNLSLDLRTGVDVSGQAEAGAADPDTLDAEAERRKNDPAELTEEEKKDLGLIEKLGGVEERRNDPVSPNLGDEGSEDEAL